MQLQKLETIYQEHLADQVVQVYQVLKVLQDLNVVLLIEEVAAEDTTGILATRRATPAMKGWMWEGGGGAAATVGRARDGEEEPEKRREREPASHGSAE